MNEEGIKVSARPILVLSSTEDAVEAFKTMFWKSYKDGRTSKHCESNFPSEMSDFSCQHQKFARPEIYVVS